MRFDYTVPISATEWSPKIPCTITRQDPTTNALKTMGYCITVGTNEQTRLACWRATGGWLFEDFAETPIDRIKGWLELTEKLLREAAKESDDYCAGIQQWRAASDALAVVDQITQDNGVVWDADMAGLYTALRDRVRSTTKLFEDDTKDLDGRFVAHSNVSARREEATHLADGTKLTHSLIAPGAGKEITKPPQVDSSILVDIAKSIKEALGILSGAALALKFTKAIAFVATVFVVVYIIAEVVNIIKDLFD